MCWEHNHAANLLFIGLLILDLLPLMVQTCLHPYGSYALYTVRSPCEGLRCVWVCQMLQFTEG